MPSKNLTPDVFSHNIALCRHGRQWIFPALTLGCLGCDALWEPFLAERSCTPGDVSAPLGIAPIGATAFLRKDILKSGGIGGNPSAIGIGYFNSDIFSDLAIANAGGGSVSVLLGDVQGGFSNSSTPLVGVKPFSIVVADFNDDKFDDIVVANSASDNISVLLGNNNGTFKPPALSISVGKRPYALAVANLNGDGKPDLVVANANSDDISVLLGDGKGGFTESQRLFAGYQPYSVVAEKFNGDGNYDLVVANRAGNSVSVLLGDGMGGFSGPTFFPVCGHPSSLATEDFNRDGSLDLAVANQGSGNISVLLGDGMGGFHPASYIAVTESQPDTPYAVAVGYFDGDTNIDLAVTDYAKSAVIILRGDGLGGFGAGTPFKVGGLPEFMAIRDLNSDMKPDIAVANSGGYSISILLHQ